MTQGQATVAELSREALMARIAELEAAQTRGSGYKVSTKGAISRYGLSRFPVTMYASQWRKIVEDVKNGTLEAFLVSNKGKYAEKATKE